jgi:hypothetical protein
MRLPRKGVSDELAQCTVVRVYRTALLSSVVLDVRLRRPIGDESRIRNNGKRRCRHLYDGERDD